MSLLLLELDCEEGLLAELKLLEELYPREEELLLLDLDDALDLDEGLLGELGLDDEEDEKGTVQPSSAHYPEHVQPPRRKKTFREFGTAQILSRRISKCQSAPPKFLGAQLPPLLLQYLLLEHPATHLEMLAEGTVTDKKDGVGAILRNDSRSLLNQPASHRF